MNFKIEKFLKKIPFVYHIGHAIRARKERLKKDKLRKAFKLNAKTNLMAIQNTMEETGLFFFFTCGTLLGFIREKGLIAHDYDFDIAVKKDSLFSWEKIDSAMSRIGFQPNRSFCINENVEQRAYSKDGLEVDIFVEEVLNDKTMKSPYFYRRSFIQYAHNLEYSVAYMHDKEVLNITKTDILGVKVNIPENYQDILYGNYGKDWNIPNPSYNLWEAPNLEVAEELRGYRINHIGKKN